MYCTSCGSKTEEVARFCSQCGALVATNSTSSSTASPSAFAAPPFDTPRLTRILKGRKIAGVCGGLARYFGVDPTLVRILFLAGFFFPVMPAIIPYIVCWIAMPLEQPEPLVTPIYTTPVQQPTVAPR